MGLQTKIFLVSRLSKGVRFPCLLYATERWTYRSCVLGHPGDHVVSRGRAECSWHFARVGFSVSTEEEPMSASAQRRTPYLTAVRYFLAGLLLVLTSPSSLTQDSPRSNHDAPKYDHQTEIKTVGVIDEVKEMTLGSRKDFVELIVKKGDDKVPIYVCPKPFEDEMGITFAKGDEVAVTGSKVKQEDADVILAREIVKRTDTLLFRDDKGNPVWDWKTGK